MKEPRQRAADNIDDLEDIAADETTDGDLAGAIDAADLAGEAPRRVTQQNGS